MRTPFDVLGAWLERIHARSPILGYMTALAIAFVCVIALAYLNQDSSSELPIPWSKT